jgi:hypothetical protein
LSGPKFNTGKTNEQFLGQSFQFVCHSSRSAYSHPLVSVFPEGTSPLLKALSPNLGPSSSAS